MNGWSQRIVLHDDARAPWLGLHDVYQNVEDPRPPVWDLEPTRFRVDAQHGPEALIRALEEALADAKRYPVIRASEVHLGG